MRARGLLLAMLVTVAFVFGAHDSASAEKLRVFYLNSYHNGYQWSDSILEGIRSVLAESGHSIELQIEYMDTKKYRYEFIAPQLYEIYSRKFAGNPFDIVIVSDDNALDFIVEYGDRLFPGTPVVFCGINDYDPDAVQGRKITGVIESIDVRGLLDMALDFHPDKRRVIVLNDYSTTGVAITKQIAEVIPHFEGRLSFEFRNIEDLGATANLVADVPDDALVYFIPLYRNVGGRYLTAEELCSVIAEATSAPLYSNWEFLLGYGTVGGKLFSGFRHGRDAAGKALRILGGTSATTIPVQTQGSESYIFDYNVLNELGIDMDEVPEDARFINAPSAFYELDKQLFWTIIVSLVLLLVILALLARNVMRRKAVEQEMKEQLSFLELLLDTIPLLICWKDRSQRYLGVNRSFLKFFGVENPNDLLDHTDDEAMIDPEYIEQVNQYDRQVIESRQPLRKHKVALHGRDGDTVWLEINKVPLHDQRGNVVGTLSTGENITREVSLERQLVQSQKMEAIGTLAGGFAHDFNNILTSIINSTELVLMDIEEDSLAKRDLERVLAAANRGSRVVKQILTFSRPTTEGFVVTRIGDIVREALHLVERSVPRTIVLEEDIQDEDTTIYADPTQIHQVIMNLCTNAYQAMREVGGVIRVELAETVITEDWAEALNIPRGEYLRLAVIDNGPGIPHDIMDKVFDPFFTTKGKAEGTGLGLAVVHGIVKSHKGAIRLRSTQEVETVMEIFLPVRASATQSASIVPPLPLEGRERLLFVEDDEDQLLTTPRLLEQLGYSVQAIRDARVAIEMLRQRREDFDLIITDFDMPDINGLELAKQVGDFMPDLPILMISGREQVLEAAQHADNIARVVMKPYTKSKITEAIRDALGPSQQH